MGAERRAEKTTITQTQPPPLAGILATIYGPRPPELPEPAAAGLFARARRPTVGELLPKIEAAGELEAEAEEMAEDLARQAEEERRAEIRARLAAKAGQDLDELDIRAPKTAAAVIEVAVDELHSAVRIRDGEARDLRAKAANLDVFRTTLDRRDVVALAAAAGRVA